MAATTRLKKLKELYPRKTPMAVDLDGKKSTEISVEQMTGREKEIYRQRERESGNTELQRERERERS